MEKDPESKGLDGADYTTEYRAYDARVGRWISPDPVVKYYESPYAGFSNNPVYYNDPSGLDSDPPAKDIKRPDGTMGRIDQDAIVSKDGRYIFHAGSNIVGVWNDEKMHYESVDISANAVEQSSGTSEYNMEIDINNQTDNTRVAQNINIAYNYSDYSTYKPFDAFSMAPVTDDTKGWYAGLSLNTGFNRAENSGLKIADKIEVRATGNENGINGITAGVEKFGLKGTYNSNGQIGISNSFSVKGFSTPLAGAAFSIISGEGYYEAPFNFGETDINGKLIWQTSYREVNWTLSQRRYNIGPATITYQTISWDGTGGWGDSTRVNVGPGIGFGINLGPISPRAGYYKPGVWHGVSR